MKTPLRPEEHAPAGQHQISVNIDNRGGLQPEATTTEKRFLKALHWMRCPNCGHALATERHGSVDINLCPDCRGVCLDARAFESVVAPDNDFLRSCLRALGRRS